MTRRITITGKAHGGEVEITLKRYKGRKRVFERDYTAKMDDEGDVLIEDADVHTPDALINAIAQQLLI